MWVPFPLFTLGLHQMCDLSNFLTFAYEKHAKPTKMTGNYMISSDFLLKLGEITQKQQNIIVRNLKRDI